MYLLTYYKLTEAHLASHVPVIRSNCHLACHSQSWPEVYKVNIAMILDGDPLRKLAP